MEKITGKNNDLVKNVKKLLSSSKERKAQGLFVLEGARLVFDVLNSLYEIKYLIISDSAYDKYKNELPVLEKRAERSFIITDDLAARLGDTQSSQGVFAVCKMRSASNDMLNPKGRHIALDNVQDPSNLGATVRSAEALGIDTVIIGGGCDMYNPKALRASMGSMLRINIIHSASAADFLKPYSEKGMMIYGTSPSKDATPITDVDFSNGAVCVIGNEANGISNEVKELCNDLITIKMLGNAESLNASVAAAITMWEMLR